MKKSAINFLIVGLLAYNLCNAQSLPELSFAEIVKKENFIGDRWSYMEAGSKKMPTIVALHGLGGSSADWRFQLDDLSKDFHVVAWNAPGYMLSDGLKKEELGCKDYADALADFIDALKIDKIYVLGNSSGSRVGQCFAMNYPDRVIKMAFVGPSAGTKGLTVEEKEKIIVTRTAQIANGGYAFASRRVEALLGLNPTPELIEVVQYGMRTTHRRGFMQGVQLLLSTGYSPEEVGEKVKMPVLLIVGEDDRITPLAANGALLHKAMPNSRLVLLKGIGHLPHLEAPNEVNKLIRDFFGVSQMPDDRATIIKAEPTETYKKQVLRQIDSLMNYHERIILAQDTVAMRKFNPDDLVITNPFGQMIGKEKMIERVKAGIIKYSKFEKTIEHFSMEGDNVAIVAGKENVTPTTDANRADAGKAHERRFTEVWVLREGRWQRTVRHASTF